MLKRIFFFAIIVSSAFVSGCSFHFKGTDLEMDGSTATNFSLESVEIAHIVDIPVPKTLK